MATPPNGKSYGHLRTVDVAPDLGIDDPEIAKIVNDLGPGAPYEGHDHLELPDRVAMNSEKLHDTQRELRAIRAISVATFRATKILPRIEEELGKLRVTDGVARFVAKAAITATVVSATGGFLVWWWNHTAAAAKVIGF
jgi:hypothetical protein